VHALWILPPLILLAGLISARVLLHRAEAAAAALRAQLARVEDTRYELGVLRHGTAQARADIDRFRSH
jgi:hypothetical protein